MPVLCKFLVQHLGKFLPTANKNAAVGVILFILTDQFPRFFCCCAESCCKGPHLVSLGAITVMGQITRVLYRFNVFGLVGSHTHYTHALLRNALLQEVLASQPLLKTWSSH